MFSIAQDLKRDPHNAHHTSPPTMRATQEARKEAAGDSDGEWHLVERAKKRKLAKPRGRPGLRRKVPQKNLANIDDSRSRAHHGAKGQKKCRRWLFSAALVPATC